MSSYERLHNTIRELVEEFTEIRNSSLVCIPNHSVYDNILFYDSLVRPNLCLPISSIHARIYTGAQPIEGIADVIEYIGVRVDPRKVSRITVCISNTIAIVIDNTGSRIIDMPSGRDDKLRTILKNYVDNEQIPTDYAVRMIRAITASSIVPTFSLKDQKSANT